VTDAALTVIVAVPVVVLDGVMVRVKSVPEPVTSSPAFGTTAWSELVALTLTAAGGVPVMVTVTVIGSPSTVV
jgi:hypothetical protein